MSFYSIIYLYCYACLQPAGECRSEDAGHGNFAEKKHTKGNKMIRFENVTKTYKTNVGLDNVSVHIKKGDFVFLVGPSGAGKSTFIKLILKEIDAD